MSATTICLICGLALGFAAAFGGFGAFFVVLVFGGLGLLIGRWLDGDVDLAGLVRSAQDRSRR
ncbi:hypothetical protein [Nocardia wallacei]|uniref:DUF2273 domain-containing protein n=1 Tax=Nocardia wallacei TaxID=480035 RepID=A0A7G1KFF9_9NOCA|nr:hypothetical protein [Nocardia wallacei]BCK53838.1 hypothetical protein NWFMUON74_16100 [Nocardia wallacei]